MFEDKTRELILADMLEMVDSSLDKREGSVIYNALAPLAAELEFLYTALGKVSDSAYIDTADLPHLILRAKEYGIEYRESTKAIISAEIVFDGEMISVGDRFFINDIGFVYTGAVSDNGLEFLLECEEYGVVGNIESGNLVYDGLSGSVKSACITGIFVAGQDAETADKLRERYYSNLSASSFSGNIADYTEKALSVPGVGGVQVRRAWNGAGTVKLLILGNNLLPASAGVVNSVQELFDPIKDGEHTGTGIAPIDHIVTVAPAETQTINVKVKIEFEDGNNFNDVAENASNAIKEYFAELAGVWSESGTATVRIGKLESVLSTVNGIIEAYDLTLNEEKANIIFDSDSVPILGELTSYE